MSEERPDYVLADADLHLAELVNRVLDRGAVITGEMLMIRIELVAVV